MIKSKKNKILLVISMFLISILSSVIIEIYWRLGTVVMYTNNLKDAFKVDLKHLGILFLLMMGISYCIIKKGKIIFEEIYKYRFLIAIGILIICVLAEISGSSIAVWKNYLPSSDVDAGTLFGIPRPIRSDEWAVNTPMAFSQKFNSTGEFSYFSEVIRGTTTDTFIVYGQPVWNLAVLFRPFHLGYLLFGLSKGLSFFWCGRFIALLLVTFEMGMLITKKNKKLSVALAVLIGLAPTVQWWFAINGFVEMLIFGQVAILALYKYFTVDSYKFKILLMLAIFMCSGTFILTFYPPWQVPMAYVLIALFIWIIIENKKNIKFKAKRDIPIMLVYVILLSISMIYIFSKSYDTISSVLNTVYPGSRIETGSGDFLQAFASPASLFLPIKQGEGLKEVDKWLFFDLFPLGFIFTLIVLFKEKQKDILLICLLVLNIYLSWYVYIGFSETISKITLLSNSQFERCLVIVQIVNIFMLIRSLAVMKVRYNKIINAIFSAIVTIVIMLGCIKFAQNYLKNYMIISLFLLMFILIFVAVNTVKSDKIQAIFAILCIGIGLIGGFLVNPIQKGIDVIYENTIVNDIKQIVDNSNDEDTWIVEGMGFPVINLPIMVGGHTINSTNVYPTLERWRELDPEGKYEDIYNRYAHILVNIVKEETSFELIQADYFILNINVNDLKKLGVRYILSGNDLHEYSNKDISFTKIKGNNYKIYSIEYK